MTKKTRLLIVDDEPGIRKLLTFHFNFLGYETMTADNAHEAMKVLHESGPFDLIITDIRMPGPLDGIDLAETYRKDNPNQKIVFVTGYAIEEKLNKILQNPLSICFKKPFNIRELAQSVADCLQSGTFR